MRTARRTTGTDRLLAGALAALLLAAPAVAGPARPQEDAVVLSIDGEGVTAAEFLAFADALHPDRKDRRAISAGEAAEQFVRNRLLSGMALREGLDRNKAVRSRLLSRLSPLWNDLYWRDVVKPTLDNVEAELVASAPPGEESVTVRQITAPTRAKAEEAAALLAGGADFAAVARDRSSGLTAAAGGLVGEVKRHTDRYDAEVVERLFRMSPGEVTPILPTRTGFALLRVEARTSAEEARRRWVEANRASFARRRDRRAWEKARGDLLRRSGFVAATGTLGKYRKAHRNGGSLASLLDLPAAHVGGEEIRLRDVVDPAGTGSVHPGGEVEAMTRAKAEDVAVAQEAARLGLPAKYPARSRRERFLRENLLAREYVAFRTRTLSATEAEMRERFDLDRERYRIPRTLDLSFIETRSPERARKALEELAKGSPFPEVAKRWSDGSLGEGGRAGLVEEDSLDPSLAAVKSLSPGTYTKTPLTVPAADGTGDYLVLARLNAVRQGRLLAYNETDRRHLRETVLTRKRAESVRSILSEATRGRRIELLPPLAATAAGAGFAADDAPRGATTR